MSNKKPSRSKFEMPAELRAAIAPEEPKPVVGTPVTIVPPVPLVTAQPQQEPVVRPPEPPVPTKPLGLPPEQELAELQKRVASDLARIWELEHPIIEFPKMVNGRTFKDRAEQDAAGPDFADKKEKK